VTQEEKILIPDCQEVGADLLLLSHIELRQRAQVQPRASGFKPGFIQTPFSRKVANFAFTFTVTV